MFLLLTKNRLIRPNVIPGLRLTLAFTFFYLLLIVFIPLTGLFVKTTSLSASQLLSILTSPRVLHAFQLSLTTSFLAAIVNTVFGLIVAWILTRYSFPFRKLIDSIVDLPFALPTAVAGIALTAIYSPQGWIGQYFAPYGIHIAYTSIGITIALILVGLPFVVRSVQPILEDLSQDEEEAAACLGAMRFQIFRKIIFPYIAPSLLAGFAMAFARALGEYGSVIFIAGNIPRVSEIVPLLIVIELEQYDYAAACAVATIMLIISFILLFMINLLQKSSVKRKVL